MKQRQEITLKQKQTLRVTTQMRIFVELLPLTHLELREKIEEALTENPALELRNEEPEGENGKLDLPKGEEFLEFYYQEDDEGKDPPEALVPYEPEPREKIRKTFLPHFPDERERKVAEAIIDYLDEKGFLDDDSLELIMEETGENYEFVERVRKRIMQIPPYGVGAKGPLEAMREQLRHREKISPLVLSLLERENLKLIEKRQYKELAEKINCSLEELREALEELKDLKPFPGMDFYSRTPEPVNVDIVLEQEGTDFKVKIIEGELPPLRINPFYLKILEDPSAPEKLKKFARSRVKAAQWFLTALSQRKKTLKKTVEYIIEKQREFFEKGYNPEYLRPLNLKEVAAAVGVHESTISRIVSTRYISTPKGTFRLKYFFPSASGKGRRVSSIKISELIKKIISQEPKDSPYSDEEISQLLKRKGIHISRRTVAKYREELGIENAAKRKRKYDLEGI